MQGDPSSNRKPKHRADVHSDPVWSAEFVAKHYADELAKLDTVAAEFAKLTADVHDPADAAACNCDPLTDGYANIDCDTHGIPTIRRKPETD